MEATQLITPGLVIVVGFALWRLMHAEIQSLRKDLGDRIDRINDRIDRHLEQHSKEPA